MDEIDDLINQSLELDNEYTSLINDMDNIIVENKRVEEIAHNSRHYIENIEKTFSEKTGLNETDITFLFIAIALQCVRQYLITNDRFRIDDDQKASRVIKKYAPISLIGPVPYDAFKKYEYIVNTGISGSNHRYTTLGHDPILGWIFGVVNILSETVTKNNFMLETYETTLIGNEYKISNRSDISYAFILSFKRVQADYKDLILAVVKHAIHLSSDVFTTMGLPIPIINNLSPELSSKLLENGIDVYSVSRGYILSGIINMIIGAFHGLFYNPNSDITRDLYEVRTRKILSYSNTIASSSNIIYTALKKDLTKLDVGGVIQTIRRITSDKEFITNIKEEFICCEFNKLVQGESL